MAEQPIKKSKLKDLIDFWNSAFPEHILTENQLKTPDEVSFRYNIILCLSNLNINTTCFANIDNESGARLKSSRCRLVSWTNEILRIASGSAGFKICYMDLLKPKRHSVISCLNYLSNYVAYFREVYKSIPDTHKQIKELEDLKTQRNNLKRMIEASKLTRNAQGQMATFKERAEKLKKELQLINDEKNKSDFLLDEIKSQIDAISANIVREDEAKNILNTLQEVKEQFQEQDEIVTSERTRLQEMSQAIEKVQSATNKMEQIIATKSIDVSDLKDMKKEFENLSINVAKLKDKISQSTHEIQALTQVIDKKKKNIAKLTVHENEAEKTYNQVVRADMSVLKNREVILKELQNKENEIYNEQTLVKEQMELMYNVSSNIIKQMSESIYE
jgi:chromosome segregation ATPase